MVNLPEIIEVFNLGLPHGEHWAPIFQKSNSDCDGCTIATLNRPSAALHLALGPCNELLAAYIGPIYAGPI